MNPIRFSCQALLPQAPQEIAARILDVTNWPEFTGYGVLPGIREATFEVRTPDVVGSRIRVVNTDGSTHVEKILEWQPDSRIALRLQEFSPPLSRLAHQFVEIWCFVVSNQGTHVKRDMTLYPTSVWTRPLVWLISWLLKGAIRKHLHQLRDSKR